MEKKFRPVRQPSSKPIAEKEYKCTMCGKMFLTSDQRFFRSNSPMYASNNSYIHVCRVCVIDLYNHYLVASRNNVAEAILRICMRFDWYFSEEVLIACSKHKLAITNIVAAYAQTIQKAGYAKKTFDDYIRESEQKQIKYEKSDINVILGERNTTMERYWGLGFTNEEYDFLQSKYKEWASKVVIDSMTRECLVRDLCIIKLQQQKELAAGNVVIYNQLQKTFQDTLSSANLKPVQTETNEKLLEQPIGVMIDMFENSEPIPAPLPEWEDIDGIVRLFSIYFLGHLCKMLKLNNRYSEMYEAEMQKYRPKIEGGNDMDDEEIFEHLTENGFAQYDGRDDN